MQHINADLLSLHLQSDLYDAGWDGQDSYPGQTLRQARMSAINRSITKKYHGDKTDGNRDAAALALFKECNQRCKSYTGVVPRDMLETLVVGEMKSIIYDFFNPAFWDGEKEYRQPHLLNLSDIASHFGLGSGTNIGSKETDMYSKYVLSTMAHTNHSLPKLFRQAISVDRLWRDVEDFRASNQGYEYVVGSRLSFVPKSREISRTICTEPILNMLFQKGIAGVMTRRLKEVFSIDLSKQPDRNAQMARLGSLTGRFGTIDLSSASDSISLALVRDLLPSEPLQWFMRCRSDITVLPNGLREELHMISSMGNGYTFPLQTMIFAALVTAVYKVLDIKVQYFGRTSNKTGNFSVFGDDIICESQAYNVVCRCLELLGFVVNRNKSFNTGLFRESCGHDYLNGRNIRGVYVQSLVDDADYYSAINRLNRWSAQNGIMLQHTVSWLRRKCRFIGVPYDEADDAGIKIPLSLLRKVSRDCTGAIKYHALVKLPRLVHIPAVEFNEQPDPVVLQKLGDTLPRFRYHEDGLLLCLVAGSLRGGAFALRETSRARTSLRKRVCPGWDERVFACGENREFREAWLFFTEANLVS
jgi:hypothetical protein